jgi:Helix-turn-helix domain
MTLADSAKTFKERDAWMRAVLASGLPDRVVRVGISIALHLRVDAGKCELSYPTLATATGVPERTVYRLVSLLERAGWIAIQRTRGRLSNHYKLLNPATRMAGLNTDDPATPMTGLGSDNPAKAMTGSTLPKSTSNPANMVAGGKRIKRREAKKDSLALPNGRARESVQAAPNFFGTKNATDKKEKITKATGAVDGFEQFWAAYPKHVKKLAAEKAFAKALKIANADVIIAAAARYAGERAGARPEVHGASHNMVERRSLGR